MSYNIQIVDLKTFLKNEKVRFAKSFTAHSSNSSVRLENFEFYKLLGSGSFGKVVLAYKKDKKDTLYAIKIINKENIVKLRQIQNTLNEKRLLETGQFPFLVHMEYFFMDNSYLYFVLPYMEGGDLFELLRSLGRFSEYDSKFYASQMCLALEYLHYMDIVHRDLKPENILLDGRGYAKLSDYGFCKLVLGRTSSVCGTPDYLAPEILRSHGYGKSVDWWSYGVLIYELNTGVPPFYDRDETSRYKKILKGKFHIPSSFSPQLVDLVTHLIELDLSKRYGNLYKGAEDVKHHPWFKEINWLAILNRVSTPPYVPSAWLKDKGRQFSKANLQISSVDTYKNEFRDF